MAKRRFVVGIAVFLVIIAVCLVPFIVFGGRIANFSAGIKVIRDGEEITRTGEKKSDFFKLKKYGRYLALLYVEGVITDSGETYNQNWILSNIEDFTDDEKNCGILLCINSPGGGVYESDEVYLALQDYKRTTGRPIYAYMGPLAASGGYYIASAADRIYANRNTLTGSIGVIAGQSFDMTGLMEKLGVKSETIHAGANKNMLNYNEPLTDEQRAIMQSVADECYGQFTEIVASSRKMDIEKVKKLADGRIYTAKQAEANGLIDGICSFDEAKALILEKIPEKENVSTEYYRYEKAKTLVDMLTGSFAGKTRSGQVKYPAFIYEGSLR